MPISWDHITSHIIELDRLLKLYVMMMCLCEFIIVWPSVDIQGTNSTYDTSIVLTELTGNSNYVIEVIKTVHLD